MEKFYYDDWKKTGSGNTFRSFKGGYVSFNAKAGDNPFKMLGAAFGIASEQVETAIYTDESPHWRILNGDCREEVDKCDCLEALIDLYNRSREERSDWSSDHLSPKKS